MRADEQKPDTRRSGPDERASEREVPHPPKALAVHPAVVHRRRPDLPREICAVSLRKACHEAGTDEVGSRVSVGAEVSRGRNRPKSEPEGRGGQAGGLERLKARTVPWSETRVNGAAGGQ